MASPAAVLAILVEAQTGAANAALAKTDAQLRATAATAESSAAKSAASWEAAGKRMSSVGKSMTKYVTVPAVAAGAASVKLAMDFDQSMTLVQTQAGASAKEVRKLSREVLDFARSGKTQFSPNDLAQALYSIESAGIHGAKAMDTLKASSKLATVGQSDLSSTTKALAAAQKTGIKGSKNLTKEIGTLNASVGQGQMHMDDLVSAMGTGFLSTAAQMGLNLRDVGGALAELTKQGMPAAQSATRLRMTFSLMAAPSDTAAKAMQSIGLSADDLATTMRTKGLLPALQQLRDHLDGMSKTAQTQVLSKMFGGGRTSAAIIALVNHTGDLNTILQNIKKHSGEVNQSFQKMQKDPSVQLRQVWSQMQAILIDMGNKLIPKLIPVVKRVASVAERLVGAFTSAPGWLQDFLIGAIAVGPILRMAGAMGKIAGSAKLLFAAKGAGGIAGGLGGAAIRGATPANPVFVEDVSGGLGGGPVKTGEDVAAGTAAGDIAATSTKATMLKGGAILAGIGALSAAGAPGVKNTALNKLNAMAHGADPSQVLHLVGLPAVSDLLPAVQKSPSMDVVSIMKNALGIPDIGHPLNLPKHTELTSVGGPPLSQKLFTAAMDSVSGLVDKSQVSGRKITDIVTAMRDQYGSLAKAADDMTKRQVHDFLSLAVEAKTPKPVLRDLTETFAKTGKLSSQDIKGLAKITGLSAKDIRDASSKTADKWTKDQKKVRDATDQTKQHVSDAVAKQTQNVIDSYGNQSHAVKVGLDTIRDNTNKALKGLGLDKAVQFRTNEAPIGGGGVGHPIGKNRGGDIPGVGSSDTVPAMLTPGEYVVRKEQAKKHHALLDAINFQKYAKGGAVSGTAGMQPAAQQLATQFVQRFGGAISSGLRPGDTGSFHSQGLAFDWVPGNASAATRYANQIGAQLLEGIHNPAAWGSSVSWDSGKQVPSSFWGSATWADHIDHLHVAVSGAVKAAATKIARIILKGPKGSLTDMGQASLDHAWRAANRFLAKQMPTQGPEHGKATFQGINSAAEFIPFWDQVNPSVKWAANAFSKIVPAESGWNARAVNAIGLGHRGWYQFDPPTWAQFGKGSWDNAYNPLLATMAAGNVAAQEGKSGIMSRWASTFQGFRKGGMVMPPFAGNFGNGGVVGGPMGAPRTIIAHGGESVGAPTVNVILKGDLAALSDFIQVEVEDGLNGQTRLHRQKARMRR